MNPIGKALIFSIEVLSHFMRLVYALGRPSPTAWPATCCCCSWEAGWRCCSASAALGALTFPLAFVFFILEVGLIATLQAFIFATLSAIYIGGGVAEVTNQGADSWLKFWFRSPWHPQGVTDTGVTDAGEAIALGVECRSRL